MGDRRDLSRVEIEVLDALHGGATTCDEVCAAVETAAPGYVAKVLRSLVAEGWVEQRREPVTYRPLKRITITDVEA